MTTPRTGTKGHRMRRFPSFVYGRGSEPDARFSLANERTFLAWIRTSLALLAAGVALEALQLPIRAEFRFTAALVFIVLALLAAALSWTGWARTEIALRSGRALPGTPLSLLLTVGVVIATLLIAIGLFLPRS
ncbi:DUF202 domain-containing protein [Microbacterium sp. STN6]|uniref:YidH family protein n=1 Tax=Microbacterium sp. STN6 TaxID=2995588 RepID=UPI002260CA8D|nr:DUF202 domain-containing protein [Microbacterium sp. STN6]MCX7522712.1 DUF202 domain-containing protein [Microbacterium sp. STN6]